MPSIRHELRRTADVSAALNSLGLLFDIAGALTLLWFGLPRAINREGHQHLILEQIDEGEKARAARYDILARLGLIALVLGFALQLASNLVA